MGKQRGGTRVLADTHPDVQAASPWWRGMAIAGLVLLVLIVLAVAVNVVRGSEGEDREDRSHMPAPASSKPTAGGDPHATRRELRAGVPVGYDHSQSGAVQAAVNYQIARSSAKYFTDQRVRHQVLGAMMSSQSLQQQIRDEDTAMAAVLESLGITEETEDDLVARGSPMGTQVTTYTPQLTVVDVWMAGLIGTTDQEAPLPVSASWTTYTVTLRWEDGDWKMASVQSDNGPTPLETGTGDPTSVRDFQAADERFDAPPYAG